jgi:hypothetical protein
VERRLRLDFIIALCALLISLVAAAAAVYQTHVIAQQFSATVWPYVSFDVTSSPWSFDVELRNDGLGPAIIRWAKISFDGKPQPSLEKIVALVATREPQAIIAARAALRAGQNLRISTNTPHPGMVIPANAQHVVVRLTGAVLVRYFRPAVQQIEVDLCYCSLTGSCWTLRSQPDNAEPTAVASCPRA